MSPIYNVVHVILSKCERADTDISKQEGEWGWAGLGKVTTAMKCNLFNFITLIL